MFALPLHKQPIISETTPSKRVVSRGYEYEILQFTENLAENGEASYSIVVNPDRTRVFSYMASRQTTTVEKFVAAFNEEDEAEEGHNTIKISEAVEGTMITFFWNPEIDQWDICTRNGVGGNYSYLQPIRSLDDSADGGEQTISQKSFLQMVVDVFRMKLWLGSNEFAIPHKIDDLSDIPTLNSLPKEYCYTCILQHPDNHIVYDILRFTFRLNVVAIYKMVGDGTEVQEIRAETDIGLWEYANGVFDPYIQMESCVSSSDELQNSAPLSHMRDFQSLSLTSSGTYTPTQTVDEFALTHCNINKNDSVFYPPAWILTNQQTGHRVEIPNLHYQRAKELRNMQPNIRYLWFVLRRNKQIEQYLAAFPRYNTLFAQFQRDYDRFVGKVYDAYVGFYILKERLQIIPKKYFVHAAKIHHNLYLPSIAAGHKTPIRLHTVQHYFDQFKASKMFYYLCKCDESPAAATSAATSVAVVEEPTVLTTSEPTTTLTAEQ